MSYWNHLAIALIHHFTSTWIQFFTKVRLRFSRNQVIPSLMNLLSLFYCLSKNQVVHSKIISLKLASPFAPINHPFIFFDFLQDLLFVDSSLLTLFLSIWPKSSNHQFYPAAFFVLSWSFLTLAQPSNLIFARIPESMIIVLLIIVVIVKSFGLSFKFHDQVVKKMLQFAAPCFLNLLGIDQLHLHDFVVLLLITAHNHPTTTKSSC